MRNSKAQRIFAGQAIRFEPEAKGRREPASTEQWLSTFSIDDGGVARDAQRTGK
jgi:hypothetical protein